MVEIKQKEIQNHSNKKTDDKITISINGNGWIFLEETEGLKSIEIFDLKGRRIVEIPVRSSSNLFTNSNRGMISKGCYYIRLRTKTGNLIRRFVKAF